MNDPLTQLTIHEADRRYVELRAAEGVPGRYGGTLCRHVVRGDSRLLRLRFDGSPEGLALWDFLLTEEERLRKHRDEGAILVGTMKDLGTIPVMAYALPGVVAFYPDGAWWIPCMMEMSEGSFAVADSLGIDESFCPVRAMLGAFLTEKHFPIPDYLVCSVGATCDDFSVIAQRLEALGHSIMWWEVPHREVTGSIGEVVELPGGGVAARSQVKFVRQELERVRRFLAEVAGRSLDDRMLLEGIRKANLVRSHLRELRRLVFMAPLAPLPALEMLIAEMLAIHFCSDQGRAEGILGALVRRVEERIAAGDGYDGRDPARIFWVNPVADLRAMNILEKCGGRLCGTENLITHALDEIPLTVEPLEALARMVMADPMVGPSRDRADRICRDMVRFGSEGLVISRIPGASHCSVEGEIIAGYVREKLGVPVLEVEVPTLSDAIRLGLETRLASLVEVVRERRSSAGR